MLRGIRILKTQLKLRRSVGVVYDAERVAFGVEQHNEVGILVVSPTRTGRSEGD